MCVNWVDPVVIMFWEQMRLNKEKRTYFNFGSVLSVFSLALISYIYLLQKSLDRF